LACPAIVYTHADLPGGWEDSVQARLIADCPTRLFNVSPAQSTPSLRALGKQSRNNGLKNSGLLRRYAPRNDNANEAPPGSLRSPPSPYGGGMIFGAVEHCYPSPISGRVAAAGGRVGRFFIPLIDEHSHTRITPCSSG